MRPARRGCRSELYELGIPILGICYGVQLTSLLLGGKVIAASHREYGRATLKVTAPGELFHGFAVGEEIPVWMSHGDRVEALAAGLLGHRRERELSGGRGGGTGPPLLGRAVPPRGGAHARAATRSWRTSCSASAAASRPGPWPTSSTRRWPRSQAGRPQARAVCGLSGGVDSSVAAALVLRAIGDRLTCIFVDTGLQRAGEAAQVESLFRDAFKADLRVVDASARFLGALAGVTDPEKKRKIIGREFIAVFDEEASRIGGADFLVQGTLYPDVIESVSHKGPSATIKSHHNVGGLPEHMRLKLVEPLRELFKDEVRELGAELGLPRHVLWRQPFPGPGLAVRVLGEVTAESCDLLRAADTIIEQEIRAAGLYESIWQSFGVLLPVNSVGVMGDERTYAKCLVLRAVHSRDGMTADWVPLPYEVLATISSRIVNEVRGINRVVYDITSKPPATIEWE